MHIGEGQKTHISSMGLYFLNHCNKYQEGALNRIDLNTMNRPKFYPSKMQYFLYSWSVHVCWMQLHVAKFHLQHGSVVIRIACTNSSTRFFKIPTIYLPSSINLCTNTGLKNLDFVIGAKICNNTSVNPATSSKILISRVIRKINTYNTLSTYTRKRT